MRLQVFFVFHEAAVMKQASVLFVERIRIHTSYEGGK